MICDIAKAHDSFEALIIYNNKQKTQLLFSTNHFAKDLNLTMQEQIKYYKNVFENQCENARAKKNTFHASINFNINDKIDDKKALEIIHEFLEKTGYKNTAYQIYKHKDIEREHYHIVASRINNEGKKINDKFEKLKAMTLTRELEIKYGIEKTEYKSKTQRYINDITENDVFMEADISSKIRTITTGILEVYKPNDIDEFELILKKYNINLKKYYYSKSEKTLIGLAYQYEESKPVKGSNIKSRDFENLGLTSIQKILKQNNDEKLNLFYKDGKYQYIKENKIINYLYRKVKQEYTHINDNDKILDIFNEYLKIRNMELIKMKDDSCKIINHNNSMIYNADIKDNSVLLENNNFEKFQYQQTSNLNKLIKEFIKNDFKQYNDYTKHGMEKSEFEMLEEFKEKQRVLRSRKKI